MVKTSVKFQKNWNKTVGLEELRKQGTYPYRGTEGRKAKNYAPPLFFEKAGDNKKIQYQARHQTAKKGKAREITVIHMKSRIFC